MNFFEKFFQERYQCQTVRIQIRAEVLGPNWLQKFFLIMLSSLSCFYCHLLAFFFQINFFGKNLRNTIGMVHMFYCLHAV